MIETHIRPAEAGLYYFNARWYDPNLGRFITEDPIKDGLNWFAYANNNPLRYIDPTGLRAVIGENVETGKLVTEDEYEPPEVTATFRRSADSYNSAIGDLDSQGHDVVELYAKNVLGEEYILAAGDLQTVDILTDGSRDQSFIDPEKGNIQGNTIAPGPLDLIYLDSKGDNLGPEIIFANTKTIDGTKIGPDGNAIGGGENREGRWRLHNSTHPTTGAQLNNLCSDGCGIGKAETSEKIFSFFQSHVPVGYSVEGYLGEY